MANRLWIDVVESAYDLTTNEAGWLNRLVSAATPLKLGAWAYVFTCSVNDNGVYDVCETAASDSAADWSLGRASLQQIPPDIFANLFGPRPTVGLASRGLRSVPPPIAEAIKAMWRQGGGVVDHLGVKGWSPDGAAVVLGFAQTSPVRIAPRTTANLARVSAHLAAGLRLRRALGLRSPQADDPSTEAILDSKGVVVHAAEAASSRQSRRHLSEAAELRDRARGRMRQVDPDTALGIWRGLVDGRWTLLDHHDTDGKRLVLAKRNTAHVHDPKVLTERERQIVAHARLGHSNHLIAYELGLGASTVATHLATALDKLKLQARRDLIQMFGPGTLGPAQPPAAPGPQRELPTR
jgi:DNA-binding CsgD family transcriptional regulator